MEPRAQTRLYGHKGFTLIELMIVVVIATILVGIAVPSYFSQIRKSRRTEARTALMDLAGREERFFSTTNTACYSATPTDLGYPAAPGFPALVGSGYYTVTAAIPACAVGVQPAFLLTATYAGSQTQDTQCQSFTVDQTGRQAAVDSGGADNTVYCWQR